MKVEVAGVGVTRIEEMCLGLGEESSVKERKGQKVETEEVDPGT